MDHFRQADRLRVERRYEESYESFSEFLRLVDTANLGEYKSSELYYINTAKDYLARMQPYLPKPKVESPPSPVVNEKKNRKKKKRG